MWSVPESLKVSQNSKLQVPAMSTGPNAKTPSKVQRPVVPYPKSVPPTKVRVMPFGAVTRIRVAAPKEVP